MFKKFMTDESNRTLDKALPALTREVDVERGDKDYWICFGSFVLGQQTSKSDIDLLYVHHDLPHEPYRIQSSFEGRPVTIYSLSELDFKRDGSQRKYGGYFSGKVINPHVIYAKDSNKTKIIQQIAGEFIGSFAATIGSRQKSNIASASNITADCFLAFLHLCPWYQSYFMRYFTDSRFLKIWEVFQDSLTNSLLLANEITPISQGLFKYQRLLNQDEHHIETIKVVARFWALGACFHGASISFPDYYFEKSDQFLRSTGNIAHCDELHDFLINQARRMDK